VASPSLLLTPTWQVRVLAAGDHVVGGGVLVTGDRILTCVHVVNEALGRPAEIAPPAPGARVRVDVPSGSEYRPHTARVVAHTWNAERDTTLLTLDGAPLGRTPARLGARMAAIGATGRPLAVRVQGYPGDSPHGLSAEARVVGAGGDLPMRAQVQVASSYPLGFEPGFSGCGVLDTDDGAVIGIIVTGRDTGDRGAGVALMEPVEMVAPLADGLSDPELEALEPLLGALRFEAVAGAYLAATLDRLPEQVRFASAWDAFEHLRDMAPRTDGLPREVVFVEHVARVGVVDAAVLRAYSASRPPGEVPAGALALLRGGAEEAAAPCGGALVFAAEPIPDDPGRPERYVLSHWIDDGHEVTNGGSSVVSAATLPDAVVSWIEAAEARPGFWEADDTGAAPTRLEFFLPFSLLTERIAAWRLRAPASGEGERVGASYEIVLHHTERLDARERQWGRTRSRMKRRWAGLAAAGGGLLHGVPPDPPDGARVPLQDRLADTAIVAVALGSDPAHDDGRGQLYRALEAGLPTIIWLHAADSEATRSFHDSLGSKITREGGIISREDVDALPAYLHQWRVRSIDPDYADEGYDPYDIAIIHDDIRRIKKLLPTGILTSPEKAR
jgi:hypothetical protein